MHLLRSLILGVFVGVAVGMLLDGGEAGGMSDIQYLHMLLADEKQQRMALQQTVTTMQGTLSLLSEKIGMVGDTQCGCTGSSSSPSTIAFMAQLSASLSNPAVGHVIVFDDVRTNEGSAYNNVHGVFTAPVNGTYYFSLVASSPPESVTPHEIHLFILKNKVQVAYAFLDDNTHQWIRRSTTAILHLTQGDEIWVQVSKVVGPHHLGGCCFHTHFGGFLVQAD